MLITPIKQAITSASQSPISTGRGIDRRTGGTSVAATIPVNSAIEN
jgi:hypothetical protein